MSDAAMSDRDSLREFVSALALSPQAKAMALRGVEKMTEAQAFEVMTMFDEAIAAGEGFESGAST
jgi:hypothetical protein